MGGEGRRGYGGVGWGCLYRGQGYRNNGIRRQGGGVIFKERKGEMECRERYANDGRTGREGVGRWDWR